MKITFWWSLVTSFPGVSVLSFLSLRTVKTQRRNSLYNTWGSLQSLRCASSNAAQPLAGYLYNRVYRKLAVEKCDVKLWTFHPEKLIV